jgi:hypothetical protein
MRPRPWLPTSTTASAGRFGTGGRLEAPAGGAMAGRRRIARTHPYHPASRPRHSSHTRR